MVNIELEVAMSRIYYNQGMINCGTFQTPNDSLQHKKKMRISVLRLYEIIQRSLHIVTEITITGLHGDQIIQSRIVRTFALSTFQ